MISLVTKKVILTIMLLSLIVPVSAQIDNEFWFSIPYATPRHQSPVTAVLNISVPHYFDTIRTCNKDDIYLPDTIIITMPANPAYDTIFVHMEPESFTTINVPQATTTTSLHTAVDNSSFLIQSLRGTNFSVYYELTRPLNPEFFSLKGKNALGRDFFTPFQTFWRNQNHGGWTTPYEPAYSAINIVATQNNTTVTIYPTNDTYEGFGAGGSFTITLNRGETYRVVPAPCPGPDPDDGRPCTRGAERLAGTQVKSDKPISITLSDCSVVKSGWDMAGDQIVPIRNMKGNYTVGRNYVIMRGQLSNNNSGERILFVGTEDNTEIKIDGIVIGNIDQGEQISYQIMAGTSSIFAECSKPTYVYHMSGFGEEVGAAQIPSIDGCTGSLEVSFVRSIDRPFFLNLMCEGEDAKDSFFIETSLGTQWINSNKFEEVAGSGYWALKDTEKQFDWIPIGEPVRIYNTVYPFHLGVITGRQTGDGCRYGYFSDYQELETFAVTAESNTPFLIGCQACVQLQAGGGIEYEWSPSEYFENPEDVTKKEPLAFPPLGAVTTFSVRVTHPCFGDEIKQITIFLPHLPNAFFSVTRQHGCAPMEVKFSNASENAFRYVWDFGDGTPPVTVFNKDPIYRTFHNTTDTVKRYIVSLTILSNEGCYDEFIDTITVYPEINAGFTKTDTSGCHPLIVDFTDTSSGNTDTWIWHFGDGGTATDTNVSHTFTNTSRNDTTYDVMMVASSPFLCRDTAYTNVIVSPWIETGFTIDTAFACAQFEATLYNISNHVDTFFLDFGDGNDTSMTSWNKITHLYENTTNNPVIYTITLIGINEEGCGDTLSRDITVLPEVSADFTIDEESGCDSTQISTTNLSVGHDMSYKWDFGDGSSSTAFAPKHRFFNKTNDSINYTIQLVVESDYFCQDTHQIIFTSYPYIEARFAIDTTEGCPPFPVTIHNTSIGVDNYSWSFGDGNLSTSSDATVQHTYQNSSFTEDSTHTVELYASNRFGCADSLSREITVYKNIEASFSPDTNASCSPGHFNFYSTSQGASSFFWNFDDGGTSVQIDSASHTYPINNNDTSKIYHVGLLVVSKDNNCYSIADTTILVHPYNKAVFSVENYLDCSPFNASFENSSIGTSNTYRWFIDGVQDLSAPSTKTTYTNSFSNPGANNLIYQIRLEAENNEGCLSEHIDSVAVYPEITAQFNFLPDTGGCSPFPVAFTNTSVNANDYLWNFGDQSSSVQTNPSHTFYNYSKIEDTSYVVRLIAKNHDCADTTYRTFAAYAVPLADFEVDNNSDCPPFDVTITNNSLLTSGQFDWDFGDGQQETNASPSFTHTYNNPDSTINSYKLQLNVETTTGCKDSVSTQIQVYPQVIADFSYDSAGCSRFASQFTNLSTNAYQYYWDFDNGEYSNSISPKQDFVNTSDSNQNFTIHLHASSEYNCEDSINRTVTVFPTPQSRFMADPTLIIYYNDPEPVIQIENQTPYRLSWDYEWLFGDGTSSNTDDEFLSKTYTGWGPKEDNFRYTVILIATNAENPACTDTTSNIIIVKPPVPTGEIVSPDSAGCAPLSVNFNVLTEYEDSVIWDFNDGNYATIHSPSHTFNNSGFYNVQVTVYGEGGVNYDYKTIEVFHTPVVDFAVDPKTVQLPDADVHFFNQSKYGYTYLWDFGDGNTSTKESPWHKYKKEEGKSITLIVTSEEGCVSSLTKNNIVQVEAPGIVKLPNAFTPDLTGPSGGKYQDGDVHSYIFRPHWDGIDEDEYLFQIFNRWGERIFETTDVWTGWDGYYKNKLCKQDVYVWKVKGKFLNETTFEKVGTVTLLR